MINHFVSFSYKDILDNRSDAGEVFHSPSSIKLGSFRKILLNLFYLQYNLRDSAFFLFPLETGLVSFVMAGGTSSLPQYGRA